MCDTSECVCEVYRSSGTRPRGRIGPFPRILKPSKSAFRLINIGPKKQPTERRSVMK